MNQGIIIGKIVNSSGEAVTNVCAAINHIGRFTTPIRTRETTPLYPTDSHGIFRCGFGWEPTDLGNVVEQYVSDRNLLPYQLNIFDDNSHAFRLRTRVVGELNRADAEHIYNPGAFLITCVSLGNISQGIGPPPPFDRAIDILNYWAEFRSINLPSVIQQGGFMRPSPEFYALLSFIFIRI